MRKIAWSVMTLLALVVATYAAAVVFLPEARDNTVARLFANTPLPAAGHLTGGLIALLAGALQINSTIRNRFLRFHRWVGRVYVVAVLFSGVSAFALALRSTGGIVTHFGFGLLAISWILSTAVAYLRIRRGDQDGHRAWMIRSYGLTLAAITLRIYLPISQAIGLDFEAAYQAISWLCWVPNLLVIEWLILRWRSPEIVAPA